MPFENAWAGERFAFDHLSYAKVLRGYAVNGRVEYSKLKQERQDLDEYVKSLESLSKENYKEMSRDEKIAFWINAHLGLTGDNTIDKRHPGVSRIHKWITEEYESGRMTGISNEELEKRVRKYLPELFMSDLEKIKFMAAQAAVSVVKKVIDHPDMKTMKPGLQEPVMQQFIEENPSIQFAYVVDMNGRKTTRNITNIADRSKYENYGIGTDQSDREWFIKPLQSGKIHVTEFYISKMTGALCITVSAPIVDERDEMVGIFGVDIKFEDWVKRAEDIAEATQIALRGEYEAKARSDRWL